mmetsp:Transcript_27569/g.74572  ORF Transcript_27569/g.74572 Transcript_27569/m.74572 type:complete len:391 (+) Transcript_27569:262-1434(+)
MQLCPSYACTASSQPACRAPAVCVCKQPRKHVRRPYIQAYQHQHESQSQSATHTKASTTSRRTALYSIAPALFLPEIYRWLSTEISLWGQEAGYLSRRAQETVGGGTSSIQQALPSLPLDEGLAQMLLDIPLEAAREVADDVYPGPVSYEAAFSKLKAQEQPYFEAYKACGSCGRDGLRDAAWFNFLSYIQYKTLNAELQLSELPRVTANGFEYLHRNSVPMMLDMDAAEQEEAAGRASQDSMEASLAFFANKDGRAVSRFGGGSSSSSSSTTSRNGVIDIESAPSATTTVPPELISNNSSSGQTVPLKPTSALKEGKKGSSSTGESQPLPRGKYAPYSPPGASSTSMGASNGGRDWTEPFLNAAEWVMAGGARIAAARTPVNAKPKSKK